MSAIGKRAFLILFLACAIYILSFFLRLCPAVLALDLSRELMLSPGEVGLFSSTTMLAYGLMQLPSGLLADALGGRKTIVLLGALAGLATLVFAFSQSIPVMTVSRTVTGLGLAVTVPAMTLLARWFPPNMYARSSSILLCCGGLGGILAAPPLIALSDALGWRYAMAVFGFLTLAVVLCVFIFVPEKKPEAQREVKKFSFVSVLKGIRQVMCSKAFWPLALWQMCMGGTYFMLASLWWGPYLMQGCGLTKGETGFILTSASLVLLVTQPICGYLSDVVFKARRLPVMMLTFVGIIGSLFMVFMTGSMSVSVILFQTACLMVGMTSGAPLIFTMIKESFPIHLAGTATGCLNMFFPIWAAVIQTIYGVIYQADSTLAPAEAFGMASWIVVINCAVAFLLCFFMKETFPGTEKSSVFSEAESLECPKA